MKISKFVQRRTKFFSLGVNLAEAREFNTLARKFSLALKRTRKEDVLQVFQEITELFELRTAKRFGFGFWCGSVAVKLRFLYWKREIRTKDLFATCQLFVTAGAIGASRLASPIFGLSEGRRVYLVISGLIPKLMSPEGWIYRDLIRVWSAESRASVEGQKERLVFPPNSRSAKILSLQEFAGPRSSQRSPHVLLKNVSIDFQGVVWDKSSVFWSDRGSDPAAGPVAGFYENSVIGSEFNTSSVALSPRHRRSGPSHRLEHAITINGRVPDNYWHQIIEYIPRLFSDQLPDSDVVLASASRYRAVREAALIASGKGRSVIFLEEHQSARVDELVVPGFHTAVWDTQWKDPSKTTEFHHQPLIAFRHHVLEHLKVAPQEIISLPEKIYIRRQSHYRNLLNLKEIEDFVLTRGFKIVELAGLGFLQQVQLFRQARVLVGVGGAHWANCLFLRPNTQVVNIESKQMSSVSRLHEAITRLCGAQMDSAEGYSNPRNAGDALPSTSSNLHADFSISTRELAKILG